MYKSMEEKERFIQVFGIKNDIKLVLLLSGSLGKLKKINDSLYDSINWISPSFLFLLLGVLKCWAYFVNSAIIQPPTRMDFGYMFVGIDPDEHCLRNFCLGVTSH
ncbi:TPA: hypothetical protein ACT9LK_002984 [Legionella pneumophila]